MANRHFPGEVYVLPPEVGGDPKERRHILLTTCGKEDRICTLAYCSTSNLEASYGAPYYLLDPHKTRYTGSGFDQATYVYPSCLNIAGVEDLRDHCGRVVDDMVPIRDCLRSALGLGTGTATGTGRAAGSMRGQLVRVVDRLGESFDTPYAVVVTHPAYSHTRRYQLIIPIYDAEEIEPHDHDVEVESVQWLEAAGFPFTSAVLAVAFIQYAFHPTQIADQFGVTIDEPTMNQVDSALEYRFGL